MSSPQLNQIYDTPCVPHFSILFEVESLITRETSLERSKKLCRLAPLLSIPSKTSMLLFSTSILIVLVIFMIMTTMDMTILKQSIVLVMDQSKIFQLNI